MSRVDERNDPRTKRPSIFLKYLTLYISGILIMPQALTLFGSNLSLVIRSFFYMEKRLPLLTDPQTQRSANATLYR